ncbi:MAG: hypothetical protein AAB381_02085 [Patescibacteria group bacterium]
MDSFIKADIFFFIASIATGLITILISILLFYVIRAARNLHALSEALKEGFKDSEEFVIELKERLENNLVFQLFFPPARRRRVRSRESTTD